MMKPLIVEQLNVRYDAVPVLWDVDLDLPHGKLIGLVGPNGAGKSTFVKAVLGLVDIACGRVHFWGRPLSEVRQKVSYMPQKEAVDWDFPITVGELVLMGALGRTGFGRFYPKGEKQKAQEYMDWMGLGAFSGRQINELSGGQKQRAFLARALMQEAELYIMDEPFVGIDAATEELLWNRLIEMRDSGKTVVIVHHDLATLRKFVDWSILLNVRLIASGKPEEVLTQENLIQAFGKDFSLSLYKDAFILADKKGQGKA